MRKMMFEDYKGEQTFIGYSNHIRWLENDFFGGPNIDGEYLVRFKEGGCKVLHGYGRNKTGLDLVISHIKYGCSILHEDETEFSSEEILKLGNSHNIWFEKFYGEYSLEEIIVYDKNPPEYFMIPALNEDGFAKTFDDVEGEDVYKFKENHNGRTDIFEFEMVERRKIEYEKNEF